MTILLGTHTTSLEPAFGGEPALDWLKTAAVPAPKHLDSRGEVLVTYPQRLPMQSGPGVDYAHILTPEGT